MTPIDRPARAKVIVTRRLPEPVEARMAELFEATFNPDDRPSGQEELAAAARDADVLVPTVTDRIDAEVIGATDGRLRLIANFGVGTDHIDLAAAKANGVLVTNTPGVLTEDTADVAMALILAVPRRFGEGEALLRAGRWHGWGPTGLLGRSLTGATLGILGMGRIGQALARRARACGMAIHYHNRSRLPEADEREVDARFWPRLDDMLGEIDILSVNCPHTAETHNVIDAGRLACMKPDACLINTARGDIVDQDALIDALRRERLAGAGLDVYPDEPNVDPRLLNLPNVVLLPHMGSATQESRVAMGEKVIANILAWVKGDPPPDPVAEGAD